MAIRRIRKLVDVPIPAVSTAVSLAVPKANLSRTMAIRRIRKLVEVPPPAVETAVSLAVPKAKLSRTKIYNGYTIRVSEVFEGCVYLSIHDVYNAFTGKSPDCSSATAWFYRKKQVLHFAVPAFLVKTGRDDAWIETPTVSALDLIELVLNLPGKIATEHKVSLTRSQTLLMSGSTDNVTNAVAMNKVQAHLAEIGSDHLFTIFHEINQAGGLETVKILSSTSKLLEAAGVEQSALTVAATGSTNRVQEKSVSIRESMTRNLTPLDISKRGSESLKTLIRLRGNEGESAFYILELKPRWASCEVPSNIAEMVEASTVPVNARRVVYNEDAKVLCKIGISKDPYKRLETHISDYSSFFELNLVSCVQGSGRRTAEIVESALKKRLGCSGICLPTYRSILMRVDMSTSSEMWETTTDRLLDLLVYECEHIGIVPPLLAADVRGEELVLAADLETTTTPLLNAGYTPEQAFELAKLTLLNESRRVEVSLRKVEIVSEIMKSENFTSILNLAKDPKFRELLCEKDWSSFLF